MNPCLSTESATDVGHVNADVGVRQVEAVAEYVPHRVRRLGRCVNLDVVIGQRLGDNRVRLHRDVRDRRVVEALFHDEVGFLQTSIDIAHPDLLMVGNIGMRLGCEDSLHVVVGMEVLVHEQRRRGHRYPRIEDRGLRFVVYLDQCAGRASDLQGIGSDRSDRFTLIPNLSPGKDRFVLHVEAEEEIEIIPGKDRSDA